MPTMSAAFSFMSPGRHLSNSRSNATGREVDNSASLRAELDAGARTAQAVPSTKRGTGVRIDLPLAGRLQERSQLTAAHAGLRHSDSPGLAWTSPTPEQRRGVIEPFSEDEERHGEHSEDMTVPYDQWQA